MDFAIVRQNMIEGQLRPNRVTDERILEAVSKTPRELFVASPLAQLAYVDRELPIGNGRYLMNPLSICRLIQATEVEPDSAVLVIGGGGYSAALLSWLCNVVMAVESDSTLMARASHAYSVLSITNILLMQGALSTGLPKHAPYDVIVLDGAVARVPPAILDQLGENGRLVTVLYRPHMGQAVLMVKKHGLTSTLPLFDAGATLLPDFAAESSFVF